MVLMSLLKNVHSLFPRHPKVLTIGRHKSNTKSCLQYDSPPVSDTSCTLCVKFFCLYNIKKTEHLAIERAST